MKNIFKLSRFQNPRGFKQPQGSGNFRRTNSAGTGLAAVLFLTVFMLCSGCGDLNSEADGIAIGSAVDLAKIGKDPDYPLGGNYYLSSNIVFPDSPAWQSIGSDLPFTGTFDGRDYTIRNLKLDEGTGPYPDRLIGLFGHTDSASIENLNIELAANPISLTVDKQYVGAVAGYGERTSFRNVVVRPAGSAGSMSIRKSTGDIYAGGIAGKLDRGSVIKNSYSLTALNVESGGGVYAGGLAGENEGRITNSYTAGSVSAESAASLTAYAGGIAGNNTGAVENVYATGDISVTNSGIAYAGGIAGASTSSAIEHCAALGTAISAVGGSGQYLGRITGTSITLNADNFALDTMTLASSNNPASPGTPTAITGISSTDENGADKFLTDLEIPETYSDPSPGGLGWDFVDVWDWDADANRPKLRGESSPPPSIPIPIP
ncbi:MAG: hypothetical protein LBL28_03610 [Treponema sp.]|jgi:hypothetical protein|nr:hypothetical protein [Treponema sp.]